MWSFDRGLELWREGARELDAAADHSALPTLFLGAAPFMAAALLLENQQTASRSHAGRITGATR